MNDNQIAAVKQCAAGSLAGTTTFPEVVRTLTEVGIERYHADYSRGELTYYLPNGDSYTVPLTHPPHTIADSFSPDEVERAIRQSQRGEINYLQFVQQTMAAGCVGYFVQLTGRRAQYFGRSGDMHVEPFPVANL